MTEFKKLNQPPYFLAYRIYDTHSGYLSSSFGSLTGSDTDQSRILVTDLKVGDYSFDSSHPISNYEDFDAYDMPGARDAVELPLDNKPEAIKLIFWQQTQNSYRQALNFFKALKNAPKTEEKSIDDFSKEKAEVFIAPPLQDFKNIFDAPTWTEKIKKFSCAIFKTSGHHRR